MSKWNVFEKDPYDDKMNVVERLFDTVYAAKMNVVERLFDTVYEKLTMMVEERADSLPTLEELDRGDGRSDAEADEALRTLLRDTAHEIVETALVLLGGPK